MGRGTGLAAESTDDGMATTHRVIVNFSEGAYNDLNALAKRHGKTKGEVLRDAIALEGWFDEVRREGNRVLVERDGEVREIIPRGSRLGPR
jgi:hypothetical protein